MKHIIIFIFLSVFGTTMSAQSIKIDSLKTLINNAKLDTARINLKNQLIQSVRIVNLDSAIILGNGVILEARKLGYKKGEARALNNVSIALLMKGEFNTAKKNLNIAEDIVLSLKDSAALGNVYGSYGMMYGMQSKYDSSRIYYHKAIDIAERTGNTENLGQSYGNLAISYQQQSNYPQALKYQQKSLNFAEARNDISSQAYTLLNMGNTYQSMGDSLRAEKALLNSITLAKKAGLKNVEIYSYTNLASLYNDIENWDKSYNYAIKAVRLAEEIGDIPIKAASYSKAAVALANLKRYKEAEDLINKGMDDAEASGQPIIMMQLINAMGNTLMLQEKYKEAIPFYEKNLEISKNSEQYEESIGSIYFNLAECYQKTGAYEKALLNFKEYSNIEDSIRSRENIKQATEQTMNYEFDKKEQVQRMEQESKDAIAQSRQLALIIGLVLTSILVFVAYRALRIKQKGNKKLRAQKEEVQKALTKLKNTQAQLIQSEKMASLGELTAGIAHEIQNPLNFVNNFSEVSSELIVEMKEELANGNFADVQEIANDIKINLEKINHHGKRADAIVKGMLLHSGSSSVKKELTNINKLADEYLRLAYHGLRAKDKSFNATLKTDFDENIGKINIIPQDIGRVILNLVTNAFYSCAERSQSEINVKRKKEPNTYEPAVSISTKRISSSNDSNSGIEIRVTDNGTGIPKKILDKIFQPFFTTKPTGQGTGLGLSLSYDIVKAHGGELKVETEEAHPDNSDGTGTRTEFIVQLPCN